MPSPQEMIKRAKRVFGPVAETVGVEVLKEINDESEFEDIYVEKLSKIVGNAELVRNIIRKE